MFSVFFLFTVLVFFCLDACVALFSTSLSEVKPDVEVNPSALPTVSAMIPLVADSDSCS
jgi:hypothetical protein